MSPFPGALSPPRAAATPGAGSVQLPTSAPAPESDFLAKVKLLLRMGGGWELVEISASPWHPDHHSLRFSGFLQVGTGVLGADL